MEQVSPSALTTLARVKDLLFDPSLTIQVTGNTTNGSNSVASTMLQSGKTVRIGQTITGPGIPSGTTVAATSTNTLTLSQNATAANSGVVLYVIDQPVNFDTVLTRLINSVTNYIHNECGRTSFVQQTYVNDTYSIDNSRQSFLLLRNTPVFSISSLQYRAGTPTNPVWTDFIADQYELVDPRTDPVSGIVWYPSGKLRVYGGVPGSYSNSVRVSYVAGYPVDWANAGNGTTHMLPADISNVCENLVVRRFKRRQLASMSSQALEGATHSWRNTLDQEDKDIIDQYRDAHY